MTHGKNEIFNNITTICSYVCTPPSCIYGSLKPNEASWNLSWSHSKSYIERHGSNGNSSFLNRNSPTPRFCTDLRVESQ